MICLLNERFSIEMRCSVIIVITTIISVILFGCAHKGNVFSDRNVVNTRDLYSNSALINNHIDKANERNDTVTNRMSISICKDTTRYYRLRELIYNAVNYEQHFNRKVPNCRMADDASFGYWPVVSNYCRACDLYLGYLIKKSLWYNIPILGDTVIVTTVDLWIANYMESFGDRDTVKSLPVWLQEYSDEDKIIFLEHASRRKCKFCYFNDPCQIPIRQPYLWKEEADSIKTILKQIIVKHKKTLGREMTELEVFKTAFEIQFDMPIPFCDQCTNEELITVLKHIIQMNPSMDILPDTVGKYVARSLNLKKKRPMTATDVIISEFEMRYNKQIVCQQCTNEELLKIWKHFGVSRWAHPMMNRDSIPDTISVDLLRSLKKVNVPVTCCLDD